MAKTQSERLEDVEKAMTSLGDQQRIIVMQNDKTLEYLSAIYQSLVAAQEEFQEGAPQEPKQAPPDEAEVARIQELIFGGQEPTKSAQTPGWGWEREQERQAKKGENGGN